MRINDVVRTAFLLAAMAAFPAVSMAATSQACKAGEPTPESYKWNFSQEASNLLSGIQADAAKVENHAADLNAFTRSEEMSWQSHTAQLEPIKTEVNDMGKKLCRLEVIRRVVAPWQREAIDRAARQVRLMADNAQDAILFVGDHPQTLWMPTYQLYTSNLYNESRQLSNSLNEFTTLAKDRGEVQHLRKELGLKARS